MNRPTPSTTDQAAAQVTGLTAETRGRRLLSEVSCTVAAGRILAVTGSSGSGKTTLGRALLGEAGPGVTCTGTVTVAGRPVRPGTPPPGGTVAYVPQQPAAALNPVRRIGGVLREIAARHRAPGTHRADLHRTVRDVLTRVGLAADRAFLRRYPHQLSGGQQQRLVIAHALLSGARLLVADEPTTGQDSLHRTEVAAELRRLADTGVAVVLLSHDLHLVRAVADDTVVLDRGLLIRSGPPNDVLPAADNGTGGGRPAGDDPAGPPVLRVVGLVARHGGTTVLHGVDATVGAGRCLAVVGRSGSGKTTLARCIAGLHRRTAGSIELDARTLAGTLERRSRADLAAVQYVFQDARASFQPDLPVLHQVARAAVCLHGIPTGQARAAAQALLDEVGIDADRARRPPQRLSGGELQRAALARALSTRPRLLICDEITSALDAAVQNGILILLEQLRRTRGLALLVISHDAEVVVRLADDILVLDHGRIVEHGPAAALIDGGRTPLTRALLDPHVPSIMKATTSR